MALEFNIISRVLYNHRSTVPANMLRVLRWVVFKRLLLEDDNVRTTLQRLPCMSKEKFSEWFTNACLSQAAKHFSRFAKSRNSEHAYRCALLNSFFSWYMEMLAPFPERVLCVERCVNGSYGGGLGVFFKQAHYD